MNRFFAAVAVGLTMFGCAVGTDDGGPTPTPDEPQRDPPQQTLSGALQSPYDNLTSTVNDYRRPPDVGPRQAPPIPGR